MAIGAILTKIIGGNASGIVDSVGKAVDSIVTSKEEKEKLKIEMEIAVNNHIEAMQEAHNKQIELYLKDTQDARNREIQIATSDKAPLINKIITPILAIILIGLTFGLFYLVMFKQFGVEKDIIIYVLGVLSAVTTQVISYYFGSSSGSAAKQKQLDTMMNKE